MHIDAMLEYIVARLTSAVLSSETFRGEGSILVGGEALREVLTVLRDDSTTRCDLLIDICGVDYLPLSRNPRFEVVYHLYSSRHHHRLRVKHAVADSGLIVPSVVDLWPAADWFEREVFDMFGIRFANHPNLRRILTHEKFEGHPLRKDYPVNRRQGLHSPVEDLLTPKPFIP